MLKQSASRPEGELSEAWALARSSGSQMRIGDRRGCGPHWAARCPAARAADGVHGAAFRALPVQRRYSGGTDVGHGDSAAARPKERTARSEADRDEAKLHACPTAALRTASVVVRHRFAIDPPAGRARFRLDANDHSNGSQGQLARQAVVGACGTARLLFGLPTQKSPPICGPPAPWLTIRCPLLFSTAARHP